MKSTFSTRTDGVIDIDLGTEWAAFTETLMDAVTTRAPRGSDGVCPSTYWIDRGLEAVGRSQSDPDKPFLDGNATGLFVRGDQVVANSQYGHFADTAMPVSDFVKVLQLWRIEVLKALGSS